MDSGWHHLWDILYYQENNINKGEITMAKIKLYSDLQQSKKLAEILPLESADCFWDYDDLQKYHRIMWFEDGYEKDSQLRLNKNNVCAWSLAALIGVLPSNLKDRNGMVFCLSMNKEYIEYSNPNFSRLYSTYIHTCGNDNLVDACVEMIGELHKLNLL